MVVRTVSGSTKPAGRRLSSYIGRDTPNSIKIQHDPKWKGFEATTLRGSLWSLGWTVHVPTESKQGKPLSICYSVLCTPYNIGHLHTVEPFMDPSRSINMYSARPELYGVGLRG